MSYQFWQDSLAGKKPPMVVDQPELGFYRKSISERSAGGTNRRVGWEPVAVFMDGDVMVARVGTREVTDPDKLNELWSWIASNAISEEWYRAVAERGEPWPDAHDPSKNKPSEGKTIVQMREENPNFDKDLETTFAMIDAAGAKEPPDQKLIRELKEAEAGVSQYDKIDSDEMAGQSISLKNEITTLSGKLEKIREALVRPHVDAQAEINGLYNPIIKNAKALTVKLRENAGKWEDFKREAARKAEAAALEAKLKHEDEVRRAQEAGKPAPAPPPAALVNAPPPSSQIAAAVGRKASVKIAKLVTEIDIDKAFAQFRNEPGVRAVLIALAQKAVDAGLSVDGATVEERSVVK